MTATDDLFFSLIPEFAVTRYHGLCSGEKGDPQKEDFF